LRVCKSDAHKLLHQSTILLNIISFYAFSAMLDCYTCNTSCFRNGCKNLSCAKSICARLSFEHPAQNEFLLSDAISSWGAASRLVRSLATACIGSKRAAISTPSHVFHEPSKRLALSVISALDLHQVQSGSLRVPTMHM
jgi:hypothetical protein